MKNSFLRSVPAIMFLLCTVAACGLHKSGASQATRSKSSPVPANSINTDSSGTTPTPRITPAPVPNVRPNPIPNPVPPNPPM